MLPGWERLERAYPKPGRIESIMWRIDRLMPEADRQAMERAAIVNARNALHHERRRLRCPQWADKQAILAVYREAQRMTRATGIEHEVDHIVPLCGRMVSGLHVHWNLHVIPKADNQAKGNSF